MTAQFPNADPSHPAAQVRDILEECRDEALLNVQDRRSPVDAILSTINVLRRRGYLSDIGLEAVKNSIARAEGAPE